MAERHFLDYLENPLFDGSLLLERRGLSERSEFHRRQRATAEGYAARASEIQKMPLCHLGASPFLEYNEYKFVRERAMAVRVTRAGVGLTIGIIILGLIVLGGLYLAKQRGEQARRDDAIEVAQETLEAQSEVEGITPSIDGDAETQPSEEQQSSEETATENGTANEEATQTDDATDDDQVAVNELPATGAGETSALLAVAALSFAGVSYAASRRALAKARLS